MSESAESLIAYCHEKSRVCPKPQRWTALWELLPDRKRVGGGWEPPLPLILATWHDTPGMLKMLRPTEHIEWAAEHGALDRWQLFCAVCARTSGFILGIESQHVFVRYIGIDYSGAETPTSRLKSAREGRIQDVQSPANRAESLLAT